MKRPYRISPVLSRRIAKALIAAVLFAFPAIGQDSQEWTWKDRGGKVRTRTELDTIMKAHVEWLQSHSPLAEQDPALWDLPGANLSGAKLEGVNLSGADLQGANFSGGYLWHGNLIGANLFGTNFIEANLEFAYLNGADLRGARLDRAMLKEAKLLFAELDFTQLFDTDLTAADVARATVTYTTFEPKDLPNIRAIATARNLKLLTYVYNPDALAQLRKSFKDGGFLDQEREVTYALKRREAELSGPTNYIFNRVFFDLTCRYGMSPGRPLQLVMVLWLLCSFVYLIFFIHLSKRSGLYLIPSPEFGRDEKEHATSPERIRWQHGYSRGLGSKVLQELRLLRTAMFFSLMSAFNIGFRDINFGRWLRLLTKREYDIKAVGWARPVSGLQSLISVYFIGLWVLTYFGRPFE